MLVVSATLGAVVLLAAARSTASGERPDTSLPSEAEAGAVLYRTYDRATQIADVNAFCEPSFAPLMRRSHYLSVGGREAVPTEPPQVVGAWITQGERVLTVCGVDGRGHTYVATSR